LTNSKIKALYSEKIKALGLDYEEIMVSSIYGKTNVVIFGDEKKTPLLLVHGLNSGAPFAFDTISFLLKKYQIFAIDVLGQPNKSDFVRLNKKDDSYGEWLLEVINDLQIKNITFCGISYGAFPILKSLLIDDIKIKEVFLISPSAFIHGSLWKTIFKFIMPLKKFQKTKNDIYLKKCLTIIYDEFDELTLNYLKQVFLNFKMDFSLTPNFKKSELKNINIPVTIIASKNDFFVPAKKLKRKCKKHVSSLKNFEILEDSKHIPSNKVLEETFKKFTSQIYT
jgi:pimeloyl-ACP methyl ester carboxylesterase